MEQTSYHRGKVTLQKKWHPSPPPPILLSVANKGLTAIWCVSIANAGVTGAAKEMRRRSEDLSLRKIDRRKTGREGDDAGRLRKPVRTGSSGYCFGTKCSFLCRRRSPVYIQFAGLRRKRSRKSRMLALREPFVRLTFNLENLDCDCCHFRGCFVSPLRQLKQIENTNRGVSGAYEARKSLPDFSSQIKLDHYLDCIRHAVYLS